MTCAISHALLYKTKKNSLEMHALKRSYIYPRTALLSRRTLLRFSSQILTSATTALDVLPSRRPDTPHH